ncbi:MAG TPA: flagellar hook-associated protein FlgL [Polyangiaceae bacterium]|jgi:flagellar hook-associated protein 3 FlgL
MRITDAMNINTVLQTESQSSQRLAQLEATASSGVRVSQPSDDPAAFASIVQQTAQIATVQGRSSAATTAAGDLDLAGSTLDQATTLLEQVRAIAVAQSSGTGDASSRSNAAAQVDSLRQQLLALANTQGASGYLFGGTANGSPPFDSSGNFVGNSGVTHVEVASGVLAVSNANGAQAFTAAGGQDVFAALQSLSTALTNNDTSGIQASIGTIDASHDQVVAAEVDTGELSDRLHSASNAITTAVTQMQTALSSTSDADIAQTVTNMQATQTAYQAALQVNKQILSLASSVVGS